MSDRIRWADTAEGSAEGSGEDSDRVRELLAGVPDPELPALSILDLGVVRAVRWPGPVVDLTPTWSGCPATQWISNQVVMVLRQAGYPGASVREVLAPPWRSSELSDTARARLREYGIAPPNPDGDGPEICPRCGSADHERLSEFGSTPCKSLYRCRACSEPFEYFKTL